MGRPKKIKDVPAGEIVKSDGAVETTMVGAAPVSLAETITGASVDEVSTLIETSISAATAKDEVEQFLNGSPQPGSKEWHAFVMSHFQDSELIEGSPTNAGLRRVYTYLNGPIVATKIHVYKYPTEDDPYRATVGVEIRDSLGNSYSDVADISSFNTVAPYVLYPVGSACTAAENRALRKAMLINVISSEELNKTSTNSPAIIPAELASGSNNANDIQKKTIRKMADNLGINMEKLMKNGPTENKELDKITYTEAQDLIKLLNEYNRGPENAGLSIPNELF